MEEPSFFLSPLFCVSGSVLIWWLQPWAMNYLLHRFVADDDDYYKARLATACYLCFTMTLTGALGYQLHVALQARNVFVKPMLFIILWYTSAMQFFRYMHLLSIGPTAFRRHFGLTSWKRIQLFMWSAPTIQFLPSGNDKKTDEEPRSVTKKDSSSTTSLYIHHSASSELSWSHLKSEFSSALWDVVAMEVLCAAVLLLGLGEEKKLPLLLQSLIRVYIMGLSTAVLKLLVECPFYYYILRSYGTQKENGAMIDSTTTKIRIFPIYNRPHLTQSPRELWHRWSVTAGYHLRLAYYEPVLQYFRRQDYPRGGGAKVVTTARRTTTSTTQRLAATAAPFAANCLLHITWWSIVIKGELDFIYWKLLFVYPLVSFAIQDIAVQLMGNGPAEEDPSMTNRTTTTTTTTTANSTSKGRSTLLLSWQHWVVNLLVMWAGFILIGEPMSLAHGLFSQLTDVARANLLMPPLNSA